VARIDSVGGDLPAGEFSAWLETMNLAIETGGTTDVPCGECNACCRGSYFIHVDPSESESLTAIDESLLFPAPGRPEGHRLLGFDESGTCPMLREDRCTVYASRPRTCRTYDCRIFAATGIAEHGSDKSEITDRARRWRFDYADERAREQHGALIAAAAFLVGDDHDLDGLLPLNVTQLAMLIIRLNRTLIEIHGECAGEFGSAAVAMDRLRAEIEKLER
jgi:Fe-S-cluster containining protein